MLNPHPDTLAKLWKRLEENSQRIGKCLVWKGKKNNWGYGLIKFCGKYRSVHRLVFTLKVGPPKDNVLHTCDTPECWEIDHLFDGTTQENVHDAIRKGRHKTFGR
jgi:hypothetical protein